MATEGQHGPKRPARRQVDAPITGVEDTRPAGTVNIWTGRTLREFRKPKEGRRKEASQYRCLPKVDAGWTRANECGMHYCCLYFARGICHHGPDCNYLHRLPTAEDEDRHRRDYSRDIFGRERVPERLDGRKGVGTWERECKTLYIHYGGAGTLPTEQLRKLVTENFEEWGPLENVNIIPMKTIAFVRYAWRSSAEFAKAAMHQQTLRGCDTTEILDVRWANDDPNPRAVVRVQAEREEALRDAYVAAVNELEPEAKRARIQQLHLAATVAPGVASAAYPDTDAQYGGGGGTYRHTYEGWDQFHYQQQQQQGEGVGGSGGGEDDGEEIDEAAQWAAWQAWQQQHPRGWQPLPGADDPARYMRPEDHYWEAYHSSRAAAAAAASGDQAGQAGAEGQEGGGSEDAAQHALGLIAGYGSGSDSDGEGDGAAAAAPSDGAGGGREAPA